MREFARQAASLFQSAAIFRLKHTVTAVVLLTWLFPSVAPFAAKPLYEFQLLDTVDRLLAGDHLQSLTHIQQLLTDNPDSRLGYLIYADLLAAQAGLEKPVDPLADERGQASLEHLRKQLAERWRFNTELRAERTGLIPATLATLDPSHPDLIFVDLPASRLYLYSYHDGELEVTADYYASIGHNGPGKQREGDRKTPVGIYFITSYIPDGQLHERYGSGALPINYPNSLDRLKQRSGYGIWLHGTEPGWVNRGPRATDGCISLSNQDFEALYQALRQPFATPVIIDDQPQWITPGVQDPQKQELNEFSDKWHETWQLGATTTLRSFYTNPGKSVLLDTDPADGATRLVDTALYSYPGEPGHMLAVLRFSGNQDHTRSVHQFWKRQSGENWKIISETRLDPE